ncbi:hypothetical protein ACWGQ5_45050 [Streptomyces sp. NPDC055722]
MSVYNNSGGYSRRATTAADGTFMISLDADGAIQTTGEYEPGREESWTHTPAYAYLPHPHYPASESTRIRLTSPPDVNVPAGGSATVTGVVERKVGDGWVSAPNTVVNLSEAQTGSVPYSNVSDDQGRLSIPISQAGAFQLAVQATDFLQQSPAENIHVHIPQPGAQFTGLSISEDATGQGRITGHLTLGQAGLPPAGTSVQVQYSADGKTWRNAAAATVGRQGLGRDQFSCTARQGSSNANGYWRLAFLGNRDWLPVVSTPAHLWRTPTRIIGGKPSTVHPGLNQKLSFSGSVSD